MAVGGMGQHASCRASGRNISPAAPAHAYQRVLRTSTLCILQRVGEGHTSAACALQPTFRHSAIHKQSCCARRRSQQMRASTTCRQGARAHPHASTACFLQRIHGTCLHERILCPAAHLQKQSSTAIGPTARKGHMSAQLVFSSTCICMPAQCLGCSAPMAACQHSLHPPAHCDCMISTACVLQSAQPDILPAQHVSCSLPTGACPAQPACPAA
jgi:hypothetical protein